MKKARFLSTLAVLPAVLLTLVSFVSCTGGAGDGETTAPDRETDAVAQLSRKRGHPGRQKRHADGLRRIFAFGESSRALRLASELADLRTGNPTLFCCDVCPI